MKVSVVALCVCLLLTPYSGNGQTLTQPEQIHLSYGAHPSQMMVTWVTQTSVSESTVEYGITNLDMVAKGNVTKFQDGGSARHTEYIHRVLLSGLTPGQEYIYHVGSSYGWSEMFRFRTMRAGTDWSPTLAVYGDMGNKNAVALGALQKEAVTGTIDAVLHAGDFAYDLDSDNGYIGDAFMNQIQSIAAYVPYMTSVGNHEAAYNFSHYKNRFSMPGDWENLWYSFNIGSAHIIAFSTEVYYYTSYTEYGWRPIVYQYRWLEQELQEANKPENRAKHPWIITVGHKPMYCSNNDGPAEQCNNPDNLVRKGIPDLELLGLEDMFYKYGVDLQYYAHEHSYERLWPVYDRKVCNGTQEPYLNPRAPVHIITGSAGNQEGQTEFDTKLFPWSAFHSDDFGYTRMKILNGTHLYLEQISIKTAEDTGTVIDKMMLVKHEHGLGTFDCHQ